MYPLDKRRKKKSQPNNLQKLFFPAVKQKYIYVSKWITQLSKNYLNGGF